MEEGIDRRNRISANVNVNGFDRENTQTILPLFSGGRTVARKGAKPQ